MCFRKGRDEDSSDSDDDDDDKDVKRRRRGKSSSRLVLLSLIETINRFFSSDKPLVNGRPTLY